MLGRYLCQWRPARAPFPLQPARSPRRILGPSSSPCVVATRTLHRSSTSLADRLPDADADASTTETKSAAKRQDDRKLRHQLASLSDPLRLAEHVRSTLRTKRQAKDDIEALVRMASKSMSCTVSWNHLINHKMQTGHVADALKSYNDMKKRGQKPDAYTFTVLLRGLATHAHFSQSVPRALTIYHAMGAEGSHVKPSIIHTNAVLKVCARANDMDALWGVAAKIPEQGPDAADAATYTTILNAMKQNATTDMPEDFSQEELASKREEAIRHGRRMWADIVGKWREGSLMIDEALMCAMGRLLLISTRRQDWHDVLSLVEQTTNIPRLAPRNDSRTSDLKAISNGEQDAESSSSPAAELADVFEPRQESNLIKGRTTRDSSTFVQAENNTLSLVLEACMKIQASRAAQQYWVLFAQRRQENNVHAEPLDLASLHLFLRILGSARASSAVVDILQSEEVSHLRLVHTTFYLAMVACERNSHSQRVFEEATQIVSLMEEHLGADVNRIVLGMYASMAEARPEPQHILAAIGQLQKVAGYMKSVLDYGVRDDGKDASTQNQREAIRLLRRLYALTDLLVLKNQVPEEKLESVERLRKNLSLYLRGEVNRGTIPSRTAKGRQSAATPRVAARGDGTKKPGRSYHPSSAPSGRRRTSPTKHLDLGHE